MKPFPSICAILIGIVFTAAPIRPNGQQPSPLSSNPGVPSFAPLDNTVGRFMDDLGATAASLAVFKEGESIYARAFGWSDATRTQPTRSDSVFRIASNTKPFTAAIVRSLARSGRLSLRTPVFGFLDIKPYGGKWGDPRLARITVQHLLEHTAGWDKSRTFDPMYRLHEIKTEMKLSSALTTRDIIEYMLAQPLQFTPGERCVYSNFGYLALGRVIEKATGQSYGGAVQSSICRPLHIEGVHLSDLLPGLRDPREVFYPRESGLQLRLRDSVDGLAASAPALCRFLHQYWVTGELRFPKQRRSLFHFGSHPNSTTALMEQRPDGIDYALLFNSRRNEDYEADIARLRTAINAALAMLPAGK